MRNNPGMFKMYKILSLVDCTLFFIKRSVFWGKSYNAHADNQKLFDWAVWSSVCVQLMTC